LAIFSVGWGKGMRKFVENWYNSQDVVQLARRISHKKGLCGWTHADLIKQSHIKVKVKGNNKPSKLF
jgi:hypothetical protein